MPFQHNASRRYHTPKARYRVTNWPAYEVGLRRHRDLTFWLDEAALAGWQAPRRTTPGEQPRDSDLAIARVLTLRLVFHLALRQAEAFAGSVLRRLGVESAIPDHTICLGAVAALPVASPWPFGMAALSTSCSTAWGHSCPARVNGMQQNAAGHAAVAQAARGRRCRDGRGGSMSASCLHRFSRPGVPGQKALAANWVPTLSAMMSWFRCRGQPNGLADEYPRDIF
jgi:Transposase DDE domain